MASNKPNNGRNAAEQQVLLVGRRGRALVGQPFFERGEQLPLARGRVNVDAGRLALCRLDARGAQPLVDLGDAERARDVVAALVAERGLRPSFPRRLESDAKKSIEAVRADPGERKDLTSEPTFTVDPATARDFDDAVSARRESDGFRLWIHIADVAAHVKPDSGLDIEARERANSTYAPGIVSPMLPRALSDDACSLNPDVERLAVTAEILVREDGEVASASFYRSRIRSDARLDYDELDRIFSGKEQPPKRIKKALAVAREAAAARGVRAANDGLTVSGAEPEFEFSDAGDVLGAHSVPETESHRLIERLMVMTNEQVATLLERRGVPGLYRVHEQPDPPRIELLIEQLAALDVPTPPVPKDFGPKEAGRLAIEASRLVAEESKRRGHGAGPLSSLVLRAMKPARYSDQNLGHAGLASTAYAHFTSPIRRYPDLIVHRALLAAIGADEIAPDLHEVQAVAEHCSLTERESTRVERTGDDICLAFLLKRELYERGQDTKLEGEISGVIGAGAFVRFKGEKSDTYEGFLPVRQMRDDHYDLNETDSALVGSRTGRRIGFGDPIEVQVSSIETQRGRVDLMPPGSHSGGGGRRGRGQRSGSKGGGGHQRGQGGGKSKGGQSKSNGGGKPKPKGGGSQKPKGKGGGQGKPKGKSGGKPKGKSGRGGAKGKGKGGSSGSGRRGGSGKGGRR